MPVFSPDVPQAYHAVPVVDGYPVIGSVMEVDITPRVNEIEDFYYGVTDPVLIFQETGSDVRVVLRERDEMRRFLDVINGYRPGATTPVYAGETYPVDLILYLRTVDLLGVLRSVYVSDVKFTPATFGGRAADMMQRELRGRGGDFFEIQDRAICAERIFLASAGVGTWTGAITNTPMLINRPGTIWDQKYALSVLVATASGASIRKGVNAKKIDVRATTVASTRTVTITQSDLDAAQIVGTPVVAFVVYVQAATGLPVFRGLYD